MSAFLSDNFTFTTTSRTNGLSLHSTQNGILYTSHSTCTITSCTGRVVIAFSTCTVTVFAGNMFTNLDLLLYSGRNLLQCQLHTYTKVRTLASTLASAATTKTAESSKSPETAEATLASKDIAETREDILHRHTAATEASSSSTTVYAGMTELVVTSTLLSVTKHLVSLSSLLKILLSLFITWIFIGVKFDGHLTICLLYFIVTCRFRNAKHFIIISFFHHLFIFKLQPFGQS